MRFALEKYEKIYFQKVIPYIFDGNIQDLYWLVSEKGEELFAAEFLVLGAIQYLRKQIEVGRWSVKCLLL